MVKFVNLTPHEIVIFDNEGKNVIKRIPPLGQVARVSVKRTKVAEIDDIPVFRTEYGEVEGLPEPKEDTVYIVSILVLQALRGKRKDVVAPDTSPASVIRDSQGRIKGVKAFTIL